MSLSQSNSLCDEIQKNRESYTQRKAVAELLAVACDQISYYEPKGDKKSDADCKI